MLPKEPGKSCEVDSHQVSGKPEKRDRIQTMMSFIHENYSEKLTLEDIAGSALISKRECLRCFQEAIHKSPFAYLKEYRIEMAEKLLKTTSLSVMEVGLRAGFSNNAYFGKTFKEMTGKTSGEYRKSCPVTDKKRKETRYLKPETGCKKQCLLL